MNRYAIVFAYAHYETLWGPCPDVSRRLMRMRVRLGPNATIETEDEDTREAYGRIVRSRHRLMVAWDRYARRCERAKRACPMWPGTVHMRWRGSEHATIAGWLDGMGIRQAVETYAP